MERELIISFMYMNTKQTESGMYEMIKRINRNEFVHKFNDIER